MLYEFYCNTNLQIAHFHICIKEWIKDGLFFIIIDELMLIKTLIFMELKPLYLFSYHFFCCASLTQSVK